MFCPECGKKNPDEMNFCSQCGSPLIDNTQEGSSQTPKKNDKDTTGKIIGGLKQKSDVAVRKIKANPKKSILIACVIFTLIVVVGSVFSVITTPEHVAEKYFKGIVDKDWDKVYSLMSLEDSDFTSKEGFIAAMESGENDYSNLNVANYEVKENKESGSGVSEYVTIEYVNHDSSDKQSMKIHMIKQSGKKFLFFDNYKVSTNDLIATNYKVYAPHYAEISVDDIRLSNKYKTNEENGIIEYTIPQIFCGEHTIKIYGDKIEKQEETVEVSSDKSYRLSSVTLSEDEFNSLLDKSEDIFKEIISSATSGKNFEDLSIKFTSDEKSLSQIKNYYNSISKNTVAKRDVGLKSVTFKSFEPLDNNRTILNDGSIQCRLRYEYDTNSIYENYNNEFIERSSTYSKNGDLKIQFAYNNGEYVVKSISGSIYY